ncbi:MAG: hypothetical protein WB715_18755 [Roseiarcus sp.]|uniref:hypothetical protein n=1 Tax=Roseiarcus sp. TaxID=1969460 RepID=UPI003C4E7D14
MNAEANGSSGISLGRIRAAMSAFALGFGALIVAAAVIAAGVAPAEALPSYARQTGQPCAACHTAFPELTPFGRRFKIGGYTMGGGDWKGPPVAAMYMPSFTHTQSNQDSPPAPGLHTNDNLVSQQVSGFIAGQLYGNVGSFIQITSDPTVAGTTFVDASDVRYADTLKLFGKDMIWGLDANNTPTVEDPWNTTASFGWPQISSTIAPAFGPPLTHIENGYGQIVGGAGAYLFWDDMVYLDFTAYKGLPQNVLYAFNEPSPSTTDALANVAPYWRLAIEPHWGDLYWEAGTFGMYGRITPGRQYGYGTDNYLDVGFDSQIQYAGDQYSLTVKLTDIMEWQKLNATYGMGGSSNLNNTLNSFKANASFVWDHTYSVGFGYFNIAGSGDCNLYGSGNNANCTPTSIGEFNNSYISSSNGNGLILDLAYLPFSHGAPFPYSTWNVRLGLQFTDYLHLYGGTTNFDGSYIGGTHDAQGNNSVFAYAWIAF